MMHNFYPGPAALHPKVHKWFKQGVKQGLLNANHRSPQFMDLYQQVEAAFKEKLYLPQDYTLLFVSSATECWEVISQSLVQEKSYHLFNGAFGQKWHKYARQLAPQATAYEFEPNEMPQADDIMMGPEAEVICLTHNETSNGTALPLSLLKDLRAKYPNKLIAVDATSSMAGVQLPFDQADLWYASIQKCFGLPPGMGVLLVSPEAAACAHDLAESGHYNSLATLLKHASNHQTSYTPNIAAIWLLGCVLNQVPPINQVQHTLQQRQEQWYAFLQNFSSFTPYVQNTAARSTTVLTMQASPKVVKQVHQVCAQHNIVMGQGYGPLKENTFRVANFPAISAESIAHLQAVLAQHFT